jgi:hypothetical protein
VGGTRPHCVSTPPNAIPTNKEHRNVTVFPSVNRPCPCRRCSGTDLGIGCQVSGLREAPAEHGDTHPPDSADTPATSRKVGSFIYDKERGIYPLQWEDLSSFHAWH